MVRLNNMSRVDEIGLISFAFMQVELFWLISPCPDGQKSYKSFCVDCDFITEYLGS